VNIPAGALSQETPITVGPASNLPSGNIGTAYEFGPNGTTFSQTVTISFIYDEAALPSGTSELNLKLATLVNNQWQEVTGSSVNLNLNVVTGTTTGFSVYGIIAVSGTGTVPAAPAGVQATPADSQITISWNAVTGATSYNLYMASVAGVNRNNYNSLADGMKHEGIMSSFAHTGLTNGKTYYFVVTALNANGEGPESDEIAAAPSAPPPQVGRIELSGSLKRSRVGGHTATLLPNGKVLIAGTDIGVNNASTAELYEPPTTFVFVPPTSSTNPVGSMTASRAYHTASLLPSGKVLIAGGTIPIAGGSISTAEIYDPTINSFSQTGSMAMGRYYHTATLLGNGKVLLAGGNAGFGGITGAELYDPSTGTFSPTGSMGTPRFWHTATLLPNGKVLIAGGQNAANSAELYDPTTGTFSPTGGMGYFRAQHTATLLPNGKVLIAGGSGIPVGIPVGVQPLDTLESYDSITGTFSDAGKMLIPRYDHTATLLPNGLVLIIGGAANFDDPLAEVYPLSMRVFMRYDRFQHTATLMPNGEVIIVGGRCCELADTIAERYH
jgi:hypothetical protein